MLTEPVEAGSHADVLFINTDRYSWISGHAVIGVITIALERGLLHLPDASDIRLDTPAGTVRAVATLHGVRVECVVCGNAGVRPDSWPPSTLWPVRPEGRRGVR